MTRSSLQITKANFCLRLTPKAFDSVCHDLLIKKLFHSFNFSATACRFILSFVKGRIQYASAGNTSSTIRELHSGIPQGSVLGPLLFMLHIDNLFQYKHIC